MTVRGLCEYVRTLLADSGGVHIRAHGGPAGAVAMLRQKKNSELFPFVMHARHVAQQCRHDRHILSFTQITPGFFSAFKIRLVINPTQPRRCDFENKTPRYLSSGKVEHMDDDLTILPPTSHNPSSAATLRQVTCTHTQTSMVGIEGSTPKPVPGGS